MTNLIGVAGRKTAGKDVVADALVEKLGWSKLGMSDNLHNCLMVLNPIIGRRRFRIERYRDLVERVGFVEAKKHPEVRRLQQTLGTEVGRNMIDVNLWIDMTERSICDLLCQERDVIVTGIRYRNELEMIERLGGTTLWVERPGLVLADGHSSENSLGAEDFQRVIFNDGTVEDLQRKALAFTMYV